MSEKVAVFDTTLRDGEQAAGTRLGSREKLTIARQLALLNVDVIEAGYPGSSPEDFEAVQLIAREIEGPADLRLSRAVAGDIEACGKALAKARRPRIHTGIGVSDIHITGKFQDERYGKNLGEKKATILRMAVDAVKLARQFADDVEFYAEDAGRADPAYLFEMIEAAIDAGATVVNIPDTTGYAVPEQYGALIRAIREKVPNIARATISVHCHDDLGLAVANSLAGVLERRAPGGRHHQRHRRKGRQRGAGRSGHGPPHARATTSTCTPISTPASLYRTSRLVADMLGMKVPPNKAVVGGNAFSHSSGIHVDGFLKERETYEIMRPEDVGISESRVVLTARTGRHGLRGPPQEARLHALRPGIEPDLPALPGSGRQEAGGLRRGPGRHPPRRDSIPLPELYQLDYLHIYSGTSAIPTATVRLRVKDEVREGAAIGDGPVDAVCKAISAVTGTAAKLVRYEIRAVTSGTEAMGEVTVQLEDAAAEGAGAGRLHGRDRSQRQSLHRRPQQARQPGWEAVSGLALDRRRLAVQ